MLSFKCPQCHVALKVADDKAGQKGKCPKCHAPLVIPEVPALGPATICLAQQGLTGMGMKIKVSIDGHPAGLLVYKGSLNMPVAPGQHTLDLSATMCSPASETFVVRPGEIIAWAVKFAGSAVYLYRLAADGQMLERDREVAARRFRNQLILAILGVIGALIVAASFVAKALRQAAGPDLPPFSGPP